MGYPRPYVLCRIVPLLFLISGIATSAQALNVVSGTSISGASVYLSCYNYTAYKYPWQSTTADSSGIYAFDASSTYGPCGSYYTGYTYTCKVSSYLNSNNTDYVSASSSEFTADCNATTTINVDHKKKDKKIKVSLSDGVGAITSGVTVWASSSGGSSYDYSTVTSASNGVYELKAAEGSYSVGGYCTNYSSCDYSGYPSATVKLGASDTEVTAKLTFKANNSSLAIAVSDGKNPVSDVYVSAYTYSNSTSAYTSGTSTYVYVSGKTDSKGGVTLKVPAGTYTVYVSPSYGSSYSAVSKEVTVGSAELLAVSISLASKNAAFTVTVKDENGTAVKDAYVSGWTNDSGSYDSFYGQTNSSGVFSANGVEGRKYQVSAYYYPSYSSGVATSNICNYNLEGNQTAKASTSGVSVAFTFPICDHTLNFKLVDSSGALLNSVSSGWIEVKPTAISSSDGYYSGIGASISNGAGSVKVRASTKYTAKLSLWDSNYTAGDSVKLTSGVSGATTDSTFTIIPVDASITGSFVDSAGNKLSISDITYIYVYTTKDNAYRSCEIKSGSFTCNVSAGTWCLGYWVDYNSGYVSVSPGSSTQCSDVKSKDALTKNLTLLKTGKIGVTVKDPAGSPLANTWCEATATSVANYGSKKDNYYYGQGCNTDSNGTCTINVGAADAGTTYYVNAHTPYGILKENNWTHPDEQSVTIAAGGSGDVVLSFGKPDGAITINIIEGTATISAKHVGASKGILKASGDDASVIENATVDIFANSGAYATGTTDSSGSVKLNCTVADNWYAVAHHIFGNSLYMSEATKFTCSASNTEDAKASKGKDTAKNTSGTKELTIKKVASLPECQSKTFDASVATTLDCTDGFSVSFPAAVLDSYGTSVTVSVTPVVTPFKANLRPATFYGWSVKATKAATAEEIISLNGYATITCPCDTTQLDKVGLALTDTKACYYDPSQDAYKDLSSTQDTSSCKVTMTTNHLTDFVIAGNGNLKGLDGTPGGETPPEVGGTGSSASGGNSGGCGCRQGSGPVDLPTAVFALLPFLPVILIRWMLRRPT